MTRTDMRDCARIREQVEAVLSGFDASAEMRKALKEHLGTCPGCRRYEFTRRVAIERQAEAPPPKPMANQPRPAEDAADLLIHKIRTGSALSLQALARLCHACSLSDSLELCARAVAAINACPIEEASFCPGIDDLVSKEEQERSAQDDRALKSHLAACLKCWTIWTYQQLLSVTAPLRKELSSETERERRTGNRAGHGEVSPGACSSADPDGDNRMYRELRFLLVAGCVAAEMVKRHGSRKAPAELPEACADVRVLLEKLRNGQEIAPTEYARVHEHLKTCPSCRAQGEAQRDPENHGGHIEDVLVGSPSDRVRELLDSLLPFLLSRLRGARTLSLPELDWVCSVWRLLPTPEERVQVAEAMLELKIEAPPCCEGIERFLAWEDRGELSAKEEKYLRDHLKRCSTCWPLWHYKVLLRDAEPLLEKRGLLGRRTPPGSHAASTSASGDKDCALFQEILIRMFEGRTISEAESARLCRHLDDCHGCSGIEAVYRELFAEEQPELSAETAADRARFAETFVRHVADVGSRRPLALRELGWLSLACVGTSDWKSTLLDRMRGTAIEDVPYCRGVEELVLNQGGLSPLKQARLDSHLRECGKCWTLARCRSVLEAHAARQSASSHRTSSPWYRGRWFVRAYRVAALLLLAVLVGVAFTLFGQDPVDLLIQKVEAADPTEACLAARELGAYRESRAVTALGKHIFADAPSELMSECLVSLVRIGTEEAFTLLERWERLGARQQRIVFPKFWTTYPRHDRETILKTLLEKGSPRLIRFFMADSLSQREPRLVQFLVQVIETREDPKLQIDALSNLQSFHRTGGLDLGALLDKPSGAQAEFAGAIIMTARNAGDWSITARVIARLLEADPVWDTSALCVLTPSQLYLFSASDTADYLPDLIEAFAMAEGSTKTCLAAVLAEKGYSEAIDLLFDRLAVADRTERWWIIGALNGATNPAFAPRIERILEMPPPQIAGSEYQMEIEWLNDICKRLVSVERPTQE